LEEKRLGKEKQKKWGRKEGGTFSVLPGKETWEGGKKKRKEKMCQQTAIGHKRGVGGGRKGFRKTSNESRKSPPSKTVRHGKKPEGRMWWKEKTREVKCWKQKKKR